MNPELRRYAWLDLGWHRLVIAPLVLAAVAAIPIMTGANPAQPLAAGSMALFAVLTLGWGAMRAFASVTEEVRDRTWDFQRMAAFTPAALAIGKVFGAPAFQWYIGLWCLAVFAVAAPLAGVLHVPSVLLAAVACAVLLHAVGVAASTLSARAAVGERTRRTGGLVMLLLVFNMLPVAGLLGFGGSGDSQLRWWGVGVAMTTFVAWSLVAFAAWAMLGAWRAMARELREPLLPWAWAAFAAFTAIWWAGVAIPGESSASAAASLGVAGLILAFGTYLGVFTEPLTRVSLARMRRAWRAPGSRWHQRVPGWALNGGLAVIAGLFALLLSGSATEVGAWTLPAALAAPLGLMAVRDAAVVGCFALSPRMRRPVGLAVFYIGLADLLLPALFLAMGQDALARMVCPLWAIATQPLYPTMGMAVHAALALGVLAVRIAGSRDAALNPPGSRPPGR